MLLSENNYKKNGDMRNLLIFGGVMALVISKTSFTNKSVLTPLNR